MNILISGGAKNGKSMFAQRASKQMAEDMNLPLYYIATMIPGDDEDLARIERHKREREGWGFETLEVGTNLSDLLKGSDLAGVFLLDSVTALLANEMFKKDGTVDMEAPERVAEECVAFAKAMKNVLFVSDYIYADPIGCDRLTEEYRRGLAAIDRRLAQVCERVVDVTAGIPKDMK